MIDSKRKSQLLWRCRRGMLELDLILEKFVKNHIDNMTEHQVNSFEFLLTSTDPELYAWLMNQEQPQDKELQQIVDFIRANS